ncbi:MAG: ATP-dependent DNA helicase [Promethearchaeota archaeon]
MVSTAFRLQKFPPNVKEYFPFDPRPGQTLMANEIYYGALSGNQIAIEGAAGMGKTITALSALLPICKDKGLMLLYAARTHTQMRRVIEELETIHRKKGHPVSGICLHGRANMCLNDAIQETRPVEAMEMCNLLRKEHKCEWYENLKSKKIDQASGCFTAEYILEFSQKAHICPYYLAKELLPHCDVVVLTYMYLISPFIRPILFKGLKRDIRKCILVFDECHNLPHLTMNTMSLSISNRGLDRAIKEYHHFDPTGRYPLVIKVLKNFQKYLNSVKCEYGAVTEEFEIGIDKKGLIEHLSIFTAENSLDLLLFCKSKIKQLGWKVKRQRSQAKQHPYSSISHFGQFLEHLLTTFKEPQYLHYFIISNDYIQYHIRCIDCRRILWPLQKAYTIVSMSGTLDPIYAYLEICGFPKAARQRVLPSPFDYRRVGVFCIRGLDITFYNRTPKRYQMLADRCLEVVRATPGNTSIFCASYEVLEGIQKTTLQKDIEGLNRFFYSEKKDLPSKENDKIIAQFKSNGYSNKSGVLLGVCGGRNSEGVDFPGQEMLSVVIVGVPLARMTHSINALILYYTEQFGIYKGKEYAYTLPAFRRANQAAGRPIRSLTDYGTVTLLDERYSFPYYRRFLSSWLNESFKILPNIEGELEGEISRFFLLNEERS